MSAERELQPDLTRTQVLHEPSPRAGRGFSPPHPLALKSLFPQLEILELVGYGGMGAVYKARQRGLERLVALKILPPEISVESGFAERFAREARALARLNHPNIVTIFDLGKTGSLYYFLMEFVDGTNLRQLLGTHHLTPREALGIVPQICEALEYAHGEGIVHRDIKPENILLDQKGRVKVADFGLSKLLEPGPRDIQLTQSGQVLGTMHYMAPEQLERPLAVDQRADVYSLGVLIYEMLTGELPLGRFELPSKKAAVDPRIDALVLQAMERNPQQRCQSISEIRLQLETIAGVASKLSPEISRRLSYEYRSRASLFGWPLMHVAIGLNPATGRKRSARGIIAVGTAPRGIIAFGDEAVGVIACGIYGFGLISFSIIAVGIFACGSIAVGLVFAMGGMAIAPVAMGGLALGWFASGSMAWGKHTLTATSSDAAATRFFNPAVWKLVSWIFRALIVAVPLFLALGFLPKLMARMSERRHKRRLQHNRPGSS